MILAAWAALSAVLIGRLGVLRGAPLAGAPQRLNRFSLWHLAAIVALYLFFAFAAAIAFLVIQHAVAPTESATVAPASAPAATAPRIESTKGPVMIVRAPTSAPATTASRHAAPHSPQELVAILVSDSAGKLAAALAILACAHLLVVGGLAAFGMGHRQVLSGLWQGLVAAFLMGPWMLLVSLAVEAASHYFRHAEPPEHAIIQALRAHPSALAEIIMIGSAVIIAPFAEELFFRGFLQTALLRLARYRATRAGLDSGATPSTRWRVILTTSAFFAAIHLTGTNFEVLPPLLLLAVTLGYVYERTGNLWSAMTLHFLFNANTIVLVMYQIHAKGP